jgi:UDP-N-acetylmuramoyl-tripeptide--D-alanyl-D-alanine ligase
MMRLSAIAVWTHGRLLGEDTEATGVAIDTRLLKSGDLFVAIKGDRVDGHDYLADAAARGAVAALVTHKVDSPLAQIVVDDATLALGDLASAVRAQRAARIIGITGSNGKTTVKTLVAAILSRHGRTHVNAGNYNNEIGLPLTLLAMPDDTEYAVLEMGAGKPGDIGYLAAIARPDIGLVTLIAPAHLERMKSVEGVAETKGALYQALPADGVAIINADDAFASFFAGLAAGRRVIRFGLDHRADVGADILELAANRSRFVLSTPVGDAEVSLPMPGRHNVVNALAATAVALALEVPLAQIVTGLEQVDGVAGRLRRITSPTGAVLIDDSYNANPSSTKADIGRYAREQGIERLFAVGPLGAATAAAFGANAEHFTERASLIAALRGQLHDGVTCLVKGSRSAGMEHVVNALAHDQGGATDAA